MPSSRAGSSFFSTAKKRMQKMPPLLKKLLKIIHDFNAIFFHRLGRNWR